MAENPEDNQGNEHEPRPKGDGSHLDSVPDSKLTGDSTGSHLDSVRDSKLSRDTDKEDE